MTIYRQQLQAITREAAFPVADFGIDNFVLSPQHVGTLRILDYFEQWRKATEERWYHLRMEDHSIFIFSEGLRPSYAFIHSPINVPTISEYLRERDIPDCPKNRKLISEDYQSILDTADLRKHVTPIRFDYDPNGYREGVHPVAHLHIGLDNEVRIASIQMNAVGFVLFVMRHMYPESWARLITRPNRDCFTKAIRRTDSSIDARFWSPVDRIALHLA